ncbi:DUF192 domain-containing protein [Dyella jiangningensis]|uniref:DUF192 domain-containing protein n=1 Tax=Dyella jiangningensis TaxID=1379159 RepID=A0A328P7Y6_9GAMM|nr:DUF192 domain-containing protein [Dyella jiangningensis]RAO77443.1 hypothetical protein CA260_06080 [Dyella jiangningensis]
MKCGVIRSDGRLIVSTAWRADRAWSRLRGLLGREPLRADRGEALWLVPCGSVHTIGMGYPLDLVFLDRQGGVIDCHEHVGPWRVRGARGAHQTIEFASGALRRLKPRLGDAWTWELA